VCEMVHLNLITCFLAWCAARYEDVYFVFGNHEFYHSSIPVTLSKMRRIEAALPNLHVLHNRMVEKNGLLIAGTTLWSLVADDANPKRVNDFSLIHGLDIPLYQTLHAQARNFLATVPSSALVISHHAPSTHGTSNPRFERPDRAHNNQFFASDMDLRFKAWVFGHTHWAVCDEQRRLYSNPYGYSRESTGWKSPGLVVTIPRQIRSFSKIK